MGTPPIIDARHRLRWHQRLVSDASTAVMWAGWLWLWTPMLRFAPWFADLGQRSPALAKLLSSSAAGELERSVITLVGTSGTLLAWNRLPRRKRGRVDCVSHRDCARHFDVPEGLLEAGRGASVCVVHHDDRGRIVRIETREPAERAARVSA